MALFQSNSWNFWQLRFQESTELDIKRRQRVKIVNDRSLLSLQRRTPWARKKYTEGHRPVLVSCFYSCFPPKFTLDETR